MCRFALVVLLTGCIGEVGMPGGGGSGSNTVPDASVDAPKLMWVDAAPGGGNNVPCKNPVVPAPQNGHHNTGRDCLSNCHNHGFTLAGTLYTNENGNSPFAGASITITDNNGATFDIVTNTNGNFYTNRAIAFPVLVIASSCPSAVRMPLAAANGACNSCHVGGTSNQMHLP